MKESMALEMGIRIKDLRGKLGYSQGALAERVELSQNHISQVERGIKGLSRETLFKLSTALDTSVAYLMGETDNPNPSFFEVAEKIFAREGVILGKAQQPNNDLLPSNVRPPYRKMIKVPLLLKHDVVCCGKGFSYEDIERDAKEIIYIPEEDLRFYVREHPIYAVYAEGDSMEPNIRDGERYVIGPDVDVLEGDIAFVRWKGREVMRAVFTDKSGNKILRSTKPELYKDIVITPEDMEYEPFYICGKALFKVPRFEKVHGLI